MVLVTGSSRGLGEAIVYTIAKAGASDTVFAAQTTSELEAVASNLRVNSPKTKVSTTESDVTSEADVLKLVAMIKNAGYVHAGWQPIMAPMAPAAD